MNLAKPVLETLEGRSLLSTLTVTSLADAGPGTLRAIVASSVAGDTVNFAITGTIHLASPIALTHTLTLAGSGQTIDGGGSTELFDGHATNTGDVLTLNDLTLANASLPGSNYGGGALFSLQADVVLARDTFLNDSAASGGGAVAVDVGHLSATDCAFNGCGPNAIHMFVEDHLTLSGCTFVTATDTVSQPLPPYVPPVVPPSNILTVTTLADSGPGSLREAIGAVNRSPKGQPGAFPTINILVTGTEYVLSPLEVSHPCTIMGPGEDAFTLDGQGQCEVWFIYFHTADEAPDDPPLPTDLVTICDMTVANGNAAGSGYGGGGLFSRVTNVCVEDMCFENCTADSGGGACAIQFGNLMAEGCMFDGNSSTTNGGAIACAAGGTLTLSGSSFTGNAASLQGGAIFATGTSVDLTDCSLLGNAAPNGGGVYLGKLTGYTYDVASVFDAMDNVARSRY